MKKIYSSIFIMAFSMSVFSQNTTIIDPDFEQALIDLGHDTTLDGSVPTANISSITFLDVSNKNIRNLAGIEDFTALEILNVSGNRIRSNASGPTLFLTTGRPDFSNNLNLKALNISNQTESNLFFFPPILPTSIEDYNASSNSELDGLGVNSLFVNLKKLNANFCTSLVGLDIPNAPIEYLDIGMCPQLGANTFNFQTEFLISLTCNDTSVTSLDLSNSLSLTFLNCNSAQLTELNVKNGNNFFLTISTVGNFDLDTICVDDETYSNNNWSLNVDTWTTFTSNCSLSIEDYELAKSINLFPNPTKNDLTFNTSRLIDNVEVYDITGRMVKKVKTPENTISLGSLSSGIYHLKFISDNAYAVKKIIKQ